MLDDTGFLKDGKDSPGVKRQYWTLGKIGNCQIGVSVHAVGRLARCPWGGRRTARGVVRGLRAAAQGEDPDQVVFKPKFELGVELVERASGWAVRKAPVLGDHDYGRKGLAARAARSGQLRVRAGGGAGDEASEQGTSFQIRSRKTETRRALRRPQPDRKPELLAELIGQLAAAPRRNSPSATAPMASGYLHLHLRAVTPRGVAWVARGSRRQTARVAQAASYPHARNG